MRRTSRYPVQVLFMGLAVAAIAAFSLCVGSSEISLRKILETIINGKGTTEYSIVLDVRLPRIILGLAVGGSLSVAGVILQGIFRNPLVEPYTLGISGGASLAVCAGIVTGLARSIPGILPVTGFIGSAGVIVLVYFLSIRRGVLKMSGVLLTGVMVSFICSSLVMVLMALSRAEDLQGIVFWIMGSLGEPDRLLVRAEACAAVLGLVLSYFFCLDLNAFSLGEEGAVHLGINVEKTKRFLFAIASVLTGFSVSVAGVIGFVGLVVPHFVRMFFGPDHRIVLVGSFLCGAGFLVLCDTIARTIVSPVELPVGVITGILGGILFVYALTRRHIYMGEK